MFGIPGALASRIIRDPVDPRAKGPSQASPGQSEERAPPWVCDRERAKPQGGVIKGRELCRNPSPASFFT
jgi:hypothetical protein